MNVLNVKSRSARCAPRSNKFRDCAADLPARRGRPYSAATAFFDLRGVLAALAAARFFGLAGAAAALAGDLAAGAFLGADWRAGRLRRDVEPPPLSTRASISAAASSSVTVSGVFSFGRLAL